MSSASVRPDARGDAAAPRITWAGGLIALAVGGVLALLAAELALRIAMPHWREFWSGWFITMDPVAGVAIGRPGYEAMFAQNNGDFRVRLRFNEHGLRNDAPAAAANGQVWTVGDSMTFGWGVESEQTFAKVAERALGRGVYNVASPGADVAGYQALIKRMPAGVRPAAVIVGLVLENDLADYRGRGAFAPAVREAGTASLGLRDRVKMWLTANSALYNFFAVALKRSAVLTEFLISLGIVERAQGYRHVLDGADIDALVVDTADELVTLRRLLPEGAPLGVVVIPSRSEIRDGDPVYGSVRRKMLAALAARGVEAIDVFDAFKAAGFAATHFVHDGHWNARGHEIAGQAVASWLRTKGLAR